MTQASVAEANGLKTCKLTLVMPGHSDKVLKVYPAEHEAEKIWLDNTNGIARWEAVKRLMNQYAPRGEAIPDAAAYHDGKDLKTIIISESDIPLVTLDGAVLKKPPEEKPVGESAVKLNPSVENLQLRMTAMEVTQGQILAAIQNLAKPAVTIQTEAQGAVPAPAPLASGRVACDVAGCGKDVKSAMALAIHKGRYHKSSK